MHGGNKMAHNPTSVIHFSSHQDPKQRFARLEKNRGNDLRIKYSMYYKKVVSEPTESKRKLSFKVKELKFKIMVSKKAKSKSKKRISAKNYVVE